MDFGTYLSPDAGSDPATSAAWVVHDYDRVVAELRRRGVEFHDYDIPELLIVDGIRMSEDGSRSTWFSTSWATLR